MNDFTKLEQNVFNAFQTFVEENHSVSVDWVDVDYYRPGSEQFELDLTYAQEYCEEETYNEEDDNWDANFAAAWEATADARNAFVEEIKAYELS